MQSEGTAKDRKTKQYCIIEHRKELEDFDSVETKTVESVLCFAL